ncbi:hypothetical protein PY092_16170 [Muricauda sp. 334s03]|uniref:Lipoprotein n=1 Tax=Flagellimonas yonaguniensis TaxID=3031325 RepID=A0ABT5Y2T8_9FLAO|nr:hypothetical protein [[Muricauda] yonaguniensis]MDF0717700.1 hypothetical protein [[Muricauda] yonaguniensis]
MKKSFFLISYLGIMGCLWMVSCSNDENEGVVERNRTGTVLGTVSCNTGDGLAYGISVKDLELEHSDFIITASLPEEFKIKGTEIKFDMEPSNGGITFCTADFLPEQFYKVTGVTLLKENP